MIGLDMTEPTCSSEFKDLILDAKLLCEGNETIGLSNEAKEVALIFAHNFVEIWSLYPFARKQYVKCADHLHTLLCQIFWVFSFIPYRSIWNCI